MTCKLHSSQGTILRQLSLLYFIEERLTTEGWKVYFLICFICWQGLVKSIEETWWNLNRWQMNSNKVPQKLWMDLGHMIPEVPVLGSTFIGA